MAPDRYIPRERDSVTWCRSTWWGSQNECTHESLLFCSAELGDGQEEEGGGEKGGIPEIYGGGNPRTREEEGDDPFETIIETVPVPLTGTTQIS